MISNFVLVYDGIVSKLNFETRCSSSTSMVGPDCVIYSEVRSVRILDMIGALLWLFSPALKTVELTLKLASSVLSWSMTLPI